MKGREKMKGREGLSFDPFPLPPFLVKDYLSTPKMFKKESIIAPNLNTVMKYSLGYSILPLPPFTVLLSHDRLGAACSDDEDTIALIYLIRTPKKTIHQALGLGTDLVTNLSG